MRGSKAIAVHLWERIERRDHSVMRRCNRWLAPKWIRLWMLCATRGGDGWLWAGLGLVILMFGGEDRYLAVTASSIAAFLATWVFLYLKKATGRKRPCAIEPHAWAKLLPPDQFSFPSGHTMTAWAVTTPMMFFYPELAPALTFCSVSIAGSRVLLGMHFLSDVLAGSALGLVLGYLGIAAMFLF